jgi:hypothetical protein
MLTSKARLARLRRIIKRGKALVAKMEAKQKPRRKP